MRRSKLLSVVVPAFNARQRLGRCLDSLLIRNQELLAALEVIVVNDGSTDDTSEIAHRYSAAYPDVFVVIDKENGNSGSCVNAALAVARGRYFRELDSDDWLDTDALEAFVGLLADCREDIVSTLKRDHFPDGHTFSYEGIGVDYDKTCLLDEFRFKRPMDKVHFTMHAMSYRTDFLRSICYRQLEGLFYTDQDLCYFPLKAARDIRFSRLCVYQYSEGRDDQSIAIRNVIKYKHDIFLIAKQLLEDFISVENELSENRRRVLLEIVYNPVFAFYSVSGNPYEPDVEELNRLVDLQTDLKQRMDELFAICRNNNTDMTNEEIKKLQEELEKKKAEIKAIYNELIEAGAWPLDDEALDIVGGGRGFTYTGSLGFR